MKDVEHMMLLLGWYQSLVIACVDVKVLWGEKLDIAIFVPDRARPTKRRREMPIASLRK
jgi:hypothetical protein